MVCSNHGNAAMRYFFHIFDGPQVFLDEVGKSLSTPDEAVQQAKFLSAELRKAGKFCQSNLVFVADENSHRLLSVGFMKMRVGD